ncbi:MAG: L-aspartate oxidase [candidate division Zixibacteria bacterium]|nr:L-aspartate oxidase [candidate division Zixibacteria bacterium]
MRNNYQDYDFLIIGSGIAGLSLALELSELGSVAILTKKGDSDSNTNYAQGGIATVTAARDSFESHINDTLRVGCGLSKPEVVEAIVCSGPENIKWLTKLGVNFSAQNSKRRSPGEDYDLGKEGGHTHSRVLHVADYTGREIEHRLLTSIRARDNVTIFENHIAIDLLLGIHKVPPATKGVDIRVCYGVYALDVPNQIVKVFRSHRTIIASGGAGRIYYHTTNPDIATGDGIAMAYRAGAVIRNMEFVQFHPTSLYTPEGRTFLISETVRGEGGKLMTIDGRHFMADYHKDKELAPRDVVARAIDAEIKKTGDKFVYLDVRHLGSQFLQSRFPNIYQNCLRFGVDITSDPIPVVPAAHYFCGGIAVDLDGRTNIEHLFACGETACTGMHGANRLASNSLLEALAMGRFVAEYIHATFAKQKIRKYPRIRNWIDETVFDHHEWGMISHDEDTIRRLMSDYVGIVRSDKRLNRALERMYIHARDIEEFYQQNPVRAAVIELRNISAVAMLVIRSALMRLESRGLHYTIDYPDTDDVHYNRDTDIRRTDFTKMW